MNCIEADNKINMKSVDLDIVKKCRELIFSFMISNGFQDEEEAQKLEDAINLLDKMYCPRCHPTFDEDGIL